MTPKSYIRCKDCRFLLWKGESCFRPLELAIKSEFKQVPCNITLIKQSLLPDLKKPLIKSNYRFWNWFSFELGRETSLTFFFTKILRHLQTIFTIPNFPPHYASLVQPKSTPKGESNNFHIKQKQDNYRRKWHIKLANQNQSLTLRER